MGNKTRHTANLVSDNNIFVDIASDRVGIGSTQPTAKLNIIGIVSATSFRGDGSQLSGISVDSSSLVDSNSATRVQANTSGAVVTGILTATQLFGDASNVTGIVTSIIAGTNVTISGSTGAVTINASGGGSGITTANINSDTINSGTFNASGIGTFADIHVKSNPSDTRITSIAPGALILSRTTPVIYLKDNLSDTFDASIELQSNELRFRGGGNNATAIRMETIGAGVTVTGTTFSNQLSVSGVATATLFSGSGANLTNLPSSQLTGALPAIDGSNLTGIGTVTISDNAPSNPSIGDLWWESDTASGFIYYNDGNSSQWVEFNPTGSAGPANATISDNAPSSPTHGDLWWESDTATGHIYYNDGNSAQWVQFNSGSSGGSGSSGIGTSRFSVSNTTGSIGAGTTADITITGAKAYSLFKIETSHAAWVRLYTDTTSRTNDASRAYTTDPTPGSGVLAEVYTTTSGSNTFKMTPAVTGWNDDGTPSTNIYAKVTNNESTSQDITVSLTILRTED